MILFYDLRKMSIIIRKSKRHNNMVVLLCSKGKYSVSQFIVKQKQRFKRT